MPFRVSTDKMVPAEALRELTLGSFEHQALRLDDAIAENAELFLGDTKADLARLATFKDRVVVGTSDGRYFSAWYEDNQTQIRFGLPESIFVPTVDVNNVKEYVSESLFKIVDSLVKGLKTEGKDGIVNLLSLKESVDDSAKDLASLVYDIVSNDADWKVAYREHRDTIVNQLGGVVENISAAHIETKYVPLYDGTLPEDKFNMYLDPARRDLNIVAGRLETLENKVEVAYLPFIEEVNKDKSLSNEEKDTVEQFVSFASGLLAEVHDLREHVKIAVENEQCAMCLGQIHDAIAESLSDYEIAGSFIEQLATRFAA